ncbi:MAG: CPBP family intramembrane metalloprotease [Defluviitaleaceae bacterium]|nr:CPBP family intramembrane metalloprotease [Defluviitaleaceae bacterium]
MGHRRGLFFMLVLIVFTVFYAEVRGLLLYLGVIPLSLLSSPWYLIFHLCVRFLLPLALWLALFKEKIKQHLPHMRLGTSNIIYIFFISILIQPAMMFVSFFTSVIFRVQNDVPVLLESLFGTNPLWLVILAAAVTPGIVEEVVFRGYIQSVYRRRGFWIMLFMNGFLFGIMHLNAHQFLYTFLMGILFAYMVYATRSIRAGIISHFAVNASQITLAYAALQATEYLEATEDFNIDGALDYLADLDAELVTMVVMLGMVAFIVISASVGAVFLFRAFVKHNRKRASEYDALHINEETHTDVVPLSTRDRLIDAALILVIVVLYVFIVFVAR